VWIFLKRLALSSCNLKKMWLKKILVLLLTFSFLFRYMLRKGHRPKEKTSGRAESNKKLRQERREKRRKERVAQSGKSIP